MVHLVTQLGKYLVIILMLIYTFLGFMIFRYAEKKRDKIYNEMYGIMISIHFVMYLILYLDTQNVKMIMIYGAQLIILVVANLLYQWIYPNLNKLVLQHMCMLLVIGFIFIARLSINSAIRQTAFAGVSLLACIVVPIIIEKFRAMRKLSWLFGVIGIGMLLAVKVFGVNKYGATNWIVIGPVQLQPSEFVKILFVLAIAGLLAKKTEFKHVVVVSILAALHVLVLVVAKDLGGALIFFVTYLTVLTVATSQKWYFFAGLGAGSAAAMLAYKLFAHVRVRVVAWQDPWSDIPNKGYQIVQSLFAIGTGSWLGLGLTQGLPNTVPVASTDFIFSAITEEQGAVFSICVILISMSCFIMFINIAMKLKNQYYKLIALGLSVMYAFQVFLNIGGVTKLIPSTGVTLPLVSYGGTSIVSTIVMFSIIQGLYILNQNGDSYVRKR